MDDKLYNDIILLWKKGMTEKDIAYELEIPERIVYGVIKRRKNNNAEERQTSD